MQQTFQEDKIDGTDFKYDKLEDTNLKYKNSIFKFLLKNTQIRRFWLQILRIFILHQMLQLDNFEDVDFKYGNGFPEFQSVQKYTNKEVFVLVVNISHFCMNLHILKNSRVLISNMEIVFVFKFQQKIPKYKVFFENTKVFF